MSVQLYAGDSSYCETDDPAVLERVQALHRAALAQGEDMTGSSDRYMSIRLRYEATPSGGITPLPASPARRRTA